MKNIILFVLFFIPSQSYADVFGSQTRVFKIDKSFKKTLLYFSKKENQEKLLEAQGMVFIDGKLEEFETVIKKIGEPSDRVSRDNLKWEAIANGYIKAKKENQELNLKQVIYIAKKYVRIDCELKNPSGQLASFNFKLELWNKEDYTLIRITCDVLANTPCSKFRLINRIIHRKASKILHREISKGMLASEQAIREGNQNDFGSHRSSTLCK
jgi:hypothetical protein